MLNFGFMIALFAANNSDHSCGSPVLSLPEYLLQPFAQCDCNHTEEIRPATYLGWENLWIADPLLNPLIHGLCNGNHSQELQSSLKIRRSGDQNEDELWP
jgi:hypothetical protein